MRTLTTVFRSAGRKLAVTAGHAIHGYTQLIDPSSGRVVGTLERNGLSVTKLRRDLAIFRLNNEVKLARPWFHSDFLDVPRKGRAYVVAAGGKRPLTVVAVAAKPDHVLTLLGSTKPLVACRGAVLGLGDSGAPLYQEHDGELSLIGVHSGNDHERSYFTPIQTALKTLLAMI